MWSRTASRVGERSWWRHLQQRRDLLRELIARDLKLRYRGSLLGVAWTLLNPIAELLVLFFIFDRVLPLRIPNYAAFLFTGLLVFGWFQNALNFATWAIVGNRDLVKRPGMPTAILPVATVASNLVHFLFALPVLGVLLLITGVGLSPAVLALPLLIVIQFLLIASLAYPIAVINVWFRDTQHLLRIALQLVFYLTPVFYETTSIPAPYRDLYLLNPMVTIVEAYRDVLVRGVLPEPGPLVAVTLLALALLLIGLELFRRLSPRFVDEL
jgi:lipopolysaccharide transport system permease protein